MTKRAHYRTTAIIWTKREINLKAHSSQEKNQRKYFFLTKKNSPILKTNIVAKTVKKNPVLQEIALTQIMYKWH